LHSKAFGQKNSYGLILFRNWISLVGFVWTDIQALVVNGPSKQFCSVLAYYGIKKGVHILGLWVIFHMDVGMLPIIFFQNPGLIPPNYDMFAHQLDFTVRCLIIFSLQNKPSLQ